MTLLHGINRRYVIHRIYIKLYFHRKTVNIFLPIILSTWFGCSKEPSHRDGSFEYPQHMFWLRNKKKHFSLTYFITKGLAIVANFGLPIYSLHFFSCYYCHRLIYWLFVCCFRSSKLSDWLFRKSGHAHCTVRFCLTQDVSLISSYSLDTWLFINTRIIAINSRKTFNKWKTILLAFIWDPFT